jgi:hypothetical protein
MVAAARTNSQLARFIAVALVKRTPVRESLYYD